MKPRDIADALKAKLEADPSIAKIDVAGPGFLNLTLKSTVWQDLVRAILKEGAGYGAGGLSKGEKVNLEYVSANPTGPMHVGHCRGAVFGDALANLLQFAGYAVTREYYINDAGGQVDVLAKSAFLRYREALGEEIGAIPEGLYPGDYLKPVGEALAKEHGKSLLNMPEERWISLVRSFAIDRMMDMIRDDLAALNIRHDVFFSEASLTRSGTDKVKAALDVLRQKNLVFEGKLEKPKGHDDNEWEDRDANALQIDRVRRRRRPRDPKVRWQLHVFRRRHRLSLRQALPRLPAPDQRLRRRPHRLHQPHEVGCRGALRPQGRSRHQGREPREAL